MTNNFHKIKIALSLGHKLQQAWNIFETQAFGEKLC